MRSYDTSYCGIMTAILSRMAETGNAESGAHIVNIGRITRLLLRQLATEPSVRMSNADIELISAAAALHDIGKIAVPAAILNKPGALTAEETRLMRTHPAAGAAILDSLPAYRADPFVRCARDICLRHHERFDGGGYPDGLRGDAIPLSAQAVSLADAYDALTGERCYKTAIPHDYALKMILGGECGAFDPRLLKCFTRLGSSLAEWQGEFWA